MHRWRGEEVATTGGVVEEFEDKCSICTSNLPALMPYSEMYNCASTQNPL